jgi:hypothetical protein
MEEILTNSKYDKKMSFFSFTKSENRKAEQVLLRGVGTP